MEINDETLVSQFMHAQRHEMVDDGFSRRVMRKLPNRAERISRIWTLFCVACFVLLFMLCRGWEPIINWFIHVQEIIMSKNGLQSINWH